MSRHRLHCLGDLQGVHTHRTVGNLHLLIWFILLKVVNVGVNVGRDGSTSTGVISSRDAIAIQTLWSW